MDATARTYKQVRDLVPGDRFFTPGGRRLTVVKTHPAPHAEYGYVEVVTLETYASGEWFTAPGHREVEVGAP